LRKQLGGSTPQPSGNSNTDLAESVHYWPMACIR